MFRSASLLLILLAAAADAQTTNPTPPTTAELKRVLQIGSPADRTAILQRVDNGGLNAIEIDDELLSLLDRCAADASAPLRSEAAMLIGLKWIQPDNVPPESLARAIDIEARLAEDVNADVRHDAVAAGLKNAANKNAVVVRGLIDAVLRPAEWNFRVAAQSIFGLDGRCGGKVDPGLLATMLEQYWAAHDSDPDRAAAAYALYLGGTGDDPPNVERLGSIGRFSIPFQASPGCTADDITAEVRSNSPAHAVTAIVFQVARGQLQGGLLVSGVAHYRQVIDSLRYSRSITLLTDISRYGIDLLTAAQYRAMMTEAANAPPVIAPSPRSDFAATFQNLYDYLGRTYPEFAMKRIDWPAVGRELLPLSKRVRSDAEFGLLVERLVARLQDSHAVVESDTAQPPRPDLPAWDAGFNCLTDDHGEPAIYTVLPRSPADRAGVKPGMVVVAVNHIEGDKAVAAQMRRLADCFGYSSDRTLRYDAVRSFTQQRDGGKPVHLDLRDVDGHPIVLDLPASCDERYLPRLPVPRANINDSADCSFTTLSPGVGYIYVRRIRDGLEANLDAALRSLGNLHGLILDVRGNSGGGFDADTAFIDFDPHAAGHADRPRYGGPIALLIDERCISAGEGWTSWFVANHRARLFGSTTAGASSRKDEYTLTNGMYKVVVPVTPYNGFLNRPIERDGIPPDVAVRCTARDLAAGQDTVVNAAMAWLRQ